MRSPPEEIGLLKELAGNLAFGITALRNRIEHKQTEEELKKSKMLLESVFNSTEDLILVVDRDLRS